MGMTRGMLQTDLLSAARGTPILGGKRRPVASPWFVSQPVAGFAIGCG